MYSNEEPNSFFGGMAVPSWDSKDEFIADPADKCSWLFKIEVEESMLTYYLLNSHRLHIH